MRKRVCAKGSTHSILDRLCSCFHQAVSFFCSLPRIELGVVLFVETGPVLFSAVCKHKRTAISFSIRQKSPKVVVKKLSKRANEECCKLFRTRSCGQHPRCIFETKKNVSNFGESLLGILRMAMCRSCKYKTCTEKDCVQVPTTTTLVNSIRHRIIMTTDTKFHFFLKSLVISSA